MIYALCIDKRKDGSNIVEYKLKDFANKTIVVGADELKGYIRDGKITVVNLTLTSNNKLVDSGLKDLDFLRKKSKTSKSRSENIISIAETNKIIHSELENSFIYNNNLFYIDKNNMLCVIDVNTKMHKGICERVYSASYIPKDNKIHIFVIYEHNERYRLKRIVYNLDDNKVAFSYSLWFLEPNTTIGQLAKSTNIGFDKVEERPDYYVGNYKSQYDYAILPLKKQSGNGYVITGIVICDFRNEHFYKCDNRVKFFDDFVEILNTNSYFVIPFSTLSSNGSKIFIQTSNMVVILIYDGSRIEFYKEH